MKYKFENQCAGSLAVMIAATIGKEVSPTELKRAAKALAELVSRAGKNN